MSEADTAYYELNSEICGHHIYKSVWSPAIGEQLYLKKEPGNPHHDFAVAIIKDYQGAGTFQKIFTSSFNVAATHAHSIVGITAPNIYLKPGI